MAATERWSALLGVRFWLKDAFTRTYRFRVTFTPDPLRLIVWLKDAFTRTYRLRDAFTHTPRGSFHGWEGA